MSRLDPILRGTGMMRAWYAVGFLIFLYCLAMTDRLILALLAPDITADLGVSDTQIGLLFGVGFGLLYAVCGIPFAQIIDQGHRVRIVAVGVALWSLCTIGSGFADNFIELLVMRSGVAIGEAALTPAAISIIGDLFSREKRTLPTAAYASVGTFMGAGAFVVGSMALNLANLVSDQVSLAPWRLALVLVGLPGVLLALLLILTIREPDRPVGSASAYATESYATVRQAWAHVRSTGRLYGGIFVAMSAYATVGYGYLAWMPTILIRSHGLEADKAGYIFGLLGACSGLMGAVAIPTLLTTWMRAGRNDALMVIFAGGLTIGTISTIVIGVSPSLSIVLLAVAGMSFFGQSCGAILPPLIVQYVTPGQMRARILAGFFLANNLVGLTMGPALTAWIAENFFEGRFSIASGLATVAAIFGPIAVLAMVFANPSYVRAFKFAAVRDADTLAPPAPA